MIIEYSLLVSSIFIFLFGHYVFLKDTRRGINILFFLMSMAAFLAGGTRGVLPFFYPGYPEIREVLTPLERLRALIIEDSGWIGIAFLPAFFLHLSLLLIERREFLKKKINLFFFYLPSFFVAALAPIYDFFPSRIGEDIKRYLTIFMRDIVFLQYGVFILIAFFLLLKRYFSLKSHQEKVKLRYFITGISFPAILGSVFSFILPIFFNIHQAWLTWPLFVTGYLFIARGILYGRLFIDYREVLETIFKRLTELVVITDREGIILLTNEITSFKLEQTEEELIGKKISELLKGGEKRWKGLREAIEKERVIFEDKVTFLTKKEEEVPFLITASLTKEGIIFVGRDIKELVEYQEKLEEEVKARTKELEGAKRILEVKVKERTKELEALAQSLEEKVKGRTRELQKRVDELERFHKLTVGRELKMKELKEEVEGLKRAIEERKNKICS